MATPLAMNFRISFVLVVLVATLAGYVFFFELQQESERNPREPWFYNVHQDNINRIAVTYRGEEQAFARGEAFQWFFEATDEPVDLQRWSGIPLLVTGPRSRRLLEERVDDPALYGLETPTTTIAVALEDGREITVLLGDNTPDGIGHYAQLQGDNPLFIVDSSWGDVLSRLVTEPPHIPIPEPEEAPAEQEQAPAT